VLGLEALRTHASKYHLVETIPQGLCSAISPSVSEVSAYKSLPCSAQNARPTSQTIPVSAPQCGTTLLKNQRQIASQDEFSEEPGHIVEEFLTKLWRENRLSSVILSLLPLTHLGALVYFLHSLLSAFEVTVNKISIEEALELCANATVQVYCREFPNECNQRGNNQIKKDVAQLLPELPFLPKSADAKVTYWNNTSDTIHIERFLHRIASGPWEAETPQLYFAPKLKALRLVIEMANGHVPLEKKVDFAATLALTENYGVITLLPGETKTWRIGHSGRSEFKIEYKQNGRLYQTPALRPR
jgi:hypothetical protein